MVVYTECLCVEERLCVKGVCRGSADGVCKVLGVLGSMVCGCVYRMFVC